MDVQSDKDDNERIRGQQRGGGGVAKERRLTRHGHVMTGKTDGA